ncbi:MAG TPA: MMPL family transporter, partial [Solirubrobacterales bacterium]|nr:MMPL family transporter [Solirubrobacterales bacterium]
VTNMASMIGIGVAVDYSLFVLARYREERRRGLGPELARGEALASSGLAVIFSGAAVIISLAGLFMIDNQAMRSMAMGAMIVVFISLLGAVTLLPALISTLGERVESKRGAGSHASPFWTRWTNAVMARPWLAIIGVSTILLGMAVPVLSMQTGSDPLNQFPAEHDVPRGAELAAAVTGGGADEVQLLAEFRRGGLAVPANAAAVGRLNRELARDPAISRVLPPAAQPGTALLRATPVPEAGTDEADVLLLRLRERTVPGSDLAGLATVSVGGEAARTFDVRGQISGSMWKLIAFILAFSFLMLMLMLRSIVLPIKAILMNLLGVGAAYGVLVVVFQWGWLDGFLGFRSVGAIDVINVPLILAIVFGLSMDYEVFLLSRIRERWLDHGDNQRAVAEGLASSARTISSAALIMTCVFAAFTLTGVPSIKEIGMGAAIAIALDATLVRLILVPAAMKLLGEWNWWMPTWLDRLLPDMSFEGGTLPPNGNTPSPTHPPHPSPTTPVTPARPELIPSETSP